jgi:hypothetical protein
MTIKQEEIQLALLNETIHHARENSPFYQRAFQGLPGKIENVLDLRAFPTINKSIISECRREMLSDRSFPAQVGITSGSSFIAADLVLAQVFRSQSEADIVSELSAFFSSDCVEHPLALQILTTANGARFTSPPPFTFLMPLEVPFHYYHIRKLLIQEHDFTGASKRVKHLVGSVDLINLLAHLVIDSHPEDLERLALNSIICHSWMLTSTVRRFWQSTFNCDISSTYGVSEIAGANFPECPACGHYQIPPTVVAEVVRFDDPTKLVENGEAGELILTGLLPLTQMQPIIRLETNDIVSRVRECAYCDGKSIRFLGRKPWSIWDESGRLLVPSALIYDLVDALHDVSREPNIMLQRFDLGPVFGVPRYELSKSELGDSFQVLLQIELNFHPQVFQERANAIRESLTKALKELLGEWPFDISLLPPLGLARKVRRRH